MALNVQGVSRKFTLKKNGSEVILSDPNPVLTPEEVMEFYSTTYPELTTSTVNGPNVTGEGEVSYEFKTTIGTKG